MNNPNKIDFSRNEIDTMINLYNIESKSIDYIASHFNCGKHTIRKVLVSNSVVIRTYNSTRKIKFSEEERIDILNKYNANVPVYKIAKQYDCADSTIRNFLKKWGVVFISKRPEPKILLEELQSKKYGTLSVLSECSLDSEYRKVLCRCDCGNQKIIAINSLRRGETITCGDHTKHDKSGKNSKTFNGYETITGSIVNRFQKGAKQRGIEFTVTAKYLYELFISQNECCSLSGIKLILPTNSKGANKGTASLDRVDSSKGYIEGNLQWVFKPLNIMKNTLTQDEFIELCRKIAYFQDSK